MARAIIKQSKVVVMDEATSNVDSKTDQLIQKMVWESFTDSTLLVIAHRLRTVINSDSPITTHNKVCQAADLALPNSASLPHSFGPV